MNDLNLFNQEKKAWKKWMPTPGNILFTLLIIALLIFIRDAGADTDGLAGNLSNPSAAAINYQGQLTTPNGAPVSDGNYHITFAIWDAASGGNRVWGPEIHDAVPVANGFFNVGLGSEIEGGLPQSALEGDDLWLETNVNGETLSPREQLGAAPIAINVPDGAITLDKLGEQPYYFHGAFATPSEWMADVIWNGNYARFCEAIDRTYVRAELLQDHFNIDRGVGYFYKDWYYTGDRFCESDTHVWGNGEADSYYNVWQYNEGCGEFPNGTSVFWTRERSAIIWCE